MFKYSNLVLCHLALVTHFALASQHEQPTDQTSGDALVLQLVAAPSLQCPTDRTSEGILAFQCSPAAVHSLPSAALLIDDEVLPTDTNETEKTENETQQESDRVPETPPAELAEETFTAVEDSEAHWDNDANANHTTATDEDRLEKLCETAVAQRNAVAAQRDSFAQRLADLIASNQIYQAQIRKQGEDFKALSAHQETIIAQLSRMIEGKDEIIRTLNATIAETKRIQDQTDESLRQAQTNLESSRQHLTAGEGELALLREKLTQKDGEIETIKKQRDEFERLLSAPLLKK